MATISDIQSYSVFANIDNRKGKIEGHMLMLTKDQYEMIEAIIINAEVVKVKEHPTYEVQDD